MNNSKIFVVDGLQVLNKMLVDYNHNLREYQYRCEAIRNSYTQKTSTVTTTAGNIKQYTNWYKMLDTGQLKSVGKDEPDYKELYPTMPLKPVIPEHEVKDGHLIIKETIFKNYSTYFKKCYCFSMESRISKLKK